MLQFRQPLECASRPGCECRTFFRVIVIARLLGSVGVQGTRASAYAKPVNPWRGLTTCWQGCHGIYDAKGYLMYSSHTYCVKTQPERKEPSP